MFGTNISLTLPKIINRISSGLSLANQVIPIYKNIKPNIEKFKNIINNTNIKLFNSSNHQNNNIKKESNILNQIQNLPTFFH